MSSTSSFSHHPFTSTLHDMKHSSFNVWLVILTAIFFFLVLSIYNLVLSLYNLFIGNTSDDQTVEDLNTIALTTFGFFLVWLVITILTYLFLKYYNLLNSSNNNDSLEHPLLREEPSIGAI